MRMKWVYVFVSKMKICFLQSTQFRNPIHPLSPTDLKRMGLRYYTPDIHRTSMVLPLFLAQVIKAVHIPKLFPNPFKGHQGDLESNHSILRSLEAIISKWDSKCPFSKRSKSDWITWMGGTKMNSEMCISEERKKHFEIKFSLLHTFFCGGREGGCQKR